MSLPVMAPVPVPMAALKAEPALGASPEGPPEGPPEPSGLVPSAGREKTAFSTAITDVGSPLGACGDE